MSVVRLITIVFHIQQHFGDLRKRAFRDWEKQPRPFLFSDSFDEKDLVNCYEMEYVMQCGIT